jgi:hypothetical protein
MKTIHQLAAIFFASALYATSASAGLITNGDFETGDLTGWAVSQTDDNYVGVNDGDFVPFGTYSLYIGCVASLCSTSQTIGTTPGQSYIFSFEYGSDGQTPNEFVAIFNGATVFHTLDDETITAPGFTHESFIVIATGIDTTVEFLGTNPHGFLALDNVSVEAVAIPEAGSLALLLAGLVGFGLLHRRRTSVPYTSCD